MWFSKFSNDTRGSGTVEYAFLLCAILLAAGGAMRKIGPRVSTLASVTTRILGGENVAMKGDAASARSSAALGSVSGDSSSSSSSASSSAAKVSAAESQALAMKGSAYGGALLGASGSSSFGTMSTDAYASGSSAPAAARGSAASHTALASAARGPTPHFTAALFENSSATKASSSVTKSPTKNGSIASAKVEPTSSSNGKYSISAKGEAQMTALLNEAKSQADGKPPLGHCYASVADYIDAVGYGNMGKAPGSSLPSVPDAYGTYAHQFADYMNAKGADGQTNASRLGLQKLPITNPYDAPPGSIVVVRHGTPGTANPVAGDIVVVGKNGQFYNDGNMGYGGSQNFPKGNSYVLGVYAPK